MVVGSGSKDSSNGCADVSLVLMCFFSISSCLEGQMYPACDEAGCRALTHKSWTMLCATFLLRFLHLKIAGWCVGRVIDWFKSYLGCPIWKPVLGVASAHSYEWV